MQSVHKHIAVLPGDGIGPEVTNQAIRVLDTIAKREHHQFDYTFGLIGAGAIDKTGDPLPNETIEICRKSDAILLGAVGHPRFDNNPTAKIRPEQGLLRIRKELGLYANLRPIETIPSLFHLSPIKSHLLEGVDILFVRELTGGIYFGSKTHFPDHSYASDLCEYTAEEIERVAHLAFAMAVKRKRKLTLLDKSNVLETSKLWRHIVAGIAHAYPEVELNLMYVDNASIQLLLNPAQFDVILTENMFGDILSDEASVLAGSLGMLPSASIGDGTALFEPVHGTYPQAEGMDIANPIGAILSAAMMLDHFGLSKDASSVRSAVVWTIQHGFLTKDLDPMNFYFTSTIGEMVCDCLMNRAEETVHQSNIQIRKSTII